MKLCQVRHLNFIESDNIGKAPFIGNSKLWEISAEKGQNFIMNDRTNQLKCREELVKLYCYKGRCDSRTYKCVRDGTGIHLL